MPAMSLIDLEDVRAALALEHFDVLAAQSRMAPRPRTLKRSSSLPGEPRQASVMVLLYPTEAGLTFVLTRRAEHPNDVHSGQISLPGGSREPGETPIQTALRETCEEVGLEPERVTVIGGLGKLYIPPSDFEVYPVVGYLDEQPVWLPDAIEVAGILECPLAWLLDDARKVVEDWEFDGYALRVPWYNVHGNRVWGATAIILSELEHRLRQVIDGNSPEHPLA
jgi:8-oxo-dGTP pyrophosphatase MutT (NUDIX family)